MAVQSYDLIVIGSGPAGQRAAIQAAKSGRKAAVIEQREMVGGVCITTGTIPSKTMREAVLYLSGFTYQGIYGLNHHVKDKITMADLSFRVAQVIRTEVDVIRGQLEHNGVEVLNENFHRESNGLLVRRDLNHREDRESMPRCGWRFG